MRKKNQIPHWKRILESSWSAATFAEADAPEIAREFLQPAEQQELVLYAGRAGHLNPEAARKAIELCQRLKCGLAVLLSCPSPAESDLPSAEELSKTGQEALDMACRIHISCDPLPEAVKQFMSEHRRVISLVLEERQPGGQKGRRPGGSGKKWWQDLSCPVVFVPATQP